MKTSQSFGVHFEKKDTPVTTPLLSKAIEILKKYKHNLRAAVTDTVFFAISNQKVNAYLKEIAEICGIKKNITFHLARHIKIATTQINAKVLEKKISEDMASLRKKSG